MVFSFQSWVPIHIKDDIPIPILFSIFTFIFLVKLFIIKAKFIEIFLPHIHPLPLLIIAHFINLPVSHMASLSFGCYFEIFFLEGRELLLKEYFVYFLKYWELVFNQWANQ